MKTINHTLTSKFALAAFLALGTLAVTSCNKNKSQTEEVVPDGKNQVIIRISGISDGENIATNGIKSSTSVNKSTNQNSFKLVQGEAFDAIVGVDNQALASSGLKASNGTRAANTPLAPTTTYSIYFYKKNTDNTYSFVKSVPLTAAAQATIDLANGSYRWLAISYNNTEVLPTGTTPTALPADALLDINKDVLVASSVTDLSINGNSVPLNITFNRVFSEVTVEVNTLGMFAPMTETPTISVTGPVFTKKINFANGQLALESSTALNLTKTNFTDENGGAGDSYKKIATFRTAGQTDSLTVNAKVSGLKIEIDNNTTRDFGTTQSNQSIKFLPTGGKNQRLLVGIAESALTYSGVKWARSNLYYRTGGDLNTTPYRFYHTNPYSPDKSESFFSFRGHLPGRLAVSTETNQKDPCSLVYPAGLWKTPTDTQIGNLTSNQGLVDGLLGSLISALFPAAGTPGAAFGNNYIEYTPTAGVHAAYGAATNKIRFQYNGLQNTVSAASGLINVSLGEIGKTAAIWSNDRVLEGGILNLLSTGVGAWSYLASTAPAAIGLPPRPARAIASKGAGILNLAAVGLDVTGSGFMNVRCVRVPDATWNTLSKKSDYNPMPTL